MGLPHSSEKQKETTKTEPPSVSSRPTQLSRWEVEDTEPKFLPRLYCLFCIRRKQKKKKEENTRHHESTTCAQDDQQGEACHTFLLKALFISANRQKEKENVAFQRVENYQSHNENNQKKEVQTMKIDKQTNNNDENQAVCTPLRPNTDRCKVDRSLFYWRDASCFVFLVSSVRQQTIFLLKFDN